MLTTGDLDGNVIAYEYYAAGRRTEGFFSVGGVQMFHQSDNENGIAPTAGGNGFYAYGGRPSEARRPTRIPGERSERCRVNREASTPCNITTLLSTPDSAVSATYDYSPFGLTVAQSGPAASSKTYRFSTKPEDETGLYYYGFRYYNPTLGRWMSRDRETKQEAYLYLFVRNAPIGSIDGAGLCAVDTAAPTLSSGLLYANSDTAFTNVTDAFPPGYPVPQPTPLDPTDPGGPLDPNNPEPDPWISDPPNPVPLRCLQSVP